jgi:hypothetical protein
MELKTRFADMRQPAAPVRRVWYAAPGVGPAPGLRRRVIAAVPRVSRRRRMRWQAGTVFPGVGPTARMQRRWRHRSRRGMLLGAAGMAGAGAAVTAIARRRSSNGAAEAE